VTEAGSTRPAIRLKSVRIRGFKSLADLELSNFPQAAVLIGPNGAGKTNFMQIFEMLSCGLQNGGLSDYVGRHGGSDMLLCGGHKATPAIRAEIGLETDHGRCEYSFCVAHRAPDQLKFTEEKFRFNGKGSQVDDHWLSASDEGHDKARIVDAAHAPEMSERTAAAAQAAVEFLTCSRLYHFRDTSERSGLRAGWDAEDDSSLRPDGWNLAPVLGRIEREDPETYSLICLRLRSLLPNFDRFDITRIGDKAHLGWKPPGSDRFFDARDASDGSLCALALFTLLLLPRSETPHILLLDEPELGLQQSAIPLACELIRSLSAGKQCILATQSERVMDEFFLEEFLILDTAEAQTRLLRVSTDDYRDWLEDGYSTGRLWRTHLLGGHP